MASSAFKLILLFLLLAFSAEAQVDQASFQLMNEAMEWPWTTSPYCEFGCQEEEEEYSGKTSTAARRSLYSRHYYISYGALSANRIPCSARSGRSYYTNNCFRASGLVNPYFRGCSHITRCRR